MKRKGIMAFAVLCAFTLSLPAISGIKSAGTAEIA